MSSELDRFRPRTPLVGASRRVLANGPLPEGALLDLVSLECPWATKEQLSQELRDHPKVFSQRAGRWELVAEEPFVVRRVRRARRPATQRPSTRRSEAEPPGGDPTGAQESRWDLEVDVPTTNVTTSGRRVVVDLAASELPSRSFNTVAVWVHGAPNPQDRVFLGARPVDARVDLRPARPVIRLVLGPSAEPQELLAGFQPLQLGTAGVGSGGLELLSEWQATQRSLFSSEVLEQLEHRPRPERGTAPLRLLVEDLRRRKQRIRDDPEEQWPGIGQWLAGLADISPRDLEQLLIVLSDAGPQGASLALDLLGPFPPLGGDYCAAFVVEMARLTRPGAAAYAKEMLGRLRESEQIERLDPAEMDYAAGLIAWSEDRFQDLVRLWLGVADLLDDDDLERLTCAAEECPRELQQAVISSLETRAQGGERERDLLVAEARTRFRHISINEQVEGASKALAGLIDRGHYTDAWRRWDAFTTAASVGPRQRLDLLSVFELAPGTESALDLLQRLELLYYEIRGGLGGDLLRDLLAAVEIVESALNYGPTLSPTIRADLDRMGAPPLDPSRLALEGARLCLVGGHPASVDRISRHLQALGATVEHIPAHWDAHVDQRTVDLRTKSATHLVLLADVCGHQEQKILRNLTRKRGTPLVLTGGGPSRVARDLMRTETSWSLG